MEQQIRQLLTYRAEVSTILAEQPHLLTEHPPFSEHENLFISDCWEQGWPAKTCALRIRQERTHNTMVRTALASRRQLFIEVVKGLSEEEFSILLKVATPVCQEIMTRRRNRNGQ
jgi:hypothetical protein